MELGSASKQSYEDRTRNWDKDKIASLGIKSGRLCDGVLEHHHIASHFLYFPKNTPLPLFVKRSFWEKK